jgi:hypothetical protein
MYNSHLAPFIFFVNDAKEKINSEPVRPGDNTVLFKTEPRDSMYNLSFITNDPVRFTLFRFSGAFEQGVDDPKPIWQHDILSVEQEGIIGFAECFYNKKQLRFEFAYLQPLLYQKKKEQEYIRRNLSWQEMILQFDKIIRIGHRSEVDPKLIILKTIEL